MLSNMNITAKGLMLVIVPVIFEVVFVLLFYCMLQSAVYQIEHLELVKTQNNLFRNLWDGIMDSSLNVFDRRTKSEQLSALDAMNPIINSGGKLGHIDTVNYPEFAELDAEVGTCQKMLSNIVNKVRQQTLVPASSEASKKRQRVNNQEPFALLIALRDLHDHRMIVEQRLLVEEPAALSNLHRNFGWFFQCTVFASCAISVLLARAVILDETNRIETIKQNATLLAIGRILAPAQTGRDEIAQLDGVLHETAHRLQIFRSKQLAVLEFAADVACSLDRSLRFIAVGAASEKVWHRTGDDLLARSVLTIIDQSTTAHTKSVLHELMRQKAEGVFENILLCGDGTRKNFRWSVSWSEPEQKFYCLVQDVTAQRELENLKKIFLSMVSHDLCSPLATVSINLSNISTGASGPISPGVARVTDMAVRSMQRLTELVNDLMELDKLESGKLNLALEYFALSQVCIDARESLESLAMQAGVTVYGPKSDAAVFADQRRLTQAAINLLSNAIKFSPRGSEIRMSISKADGFVTLSVSDEGPGIPPEQRSALFDKYQQLAVRSQIAVKGTGLGLAIVRAIVEAHCGTIGIESNVGKGSTFWFCIREWNDIDGPTVA